MIRAVLDANVVVSAILSPKGIPAKILAAWRAEEFSVVVSEAIVSEIGRVLRYPKIKRRHRSADSLLYLLCIRVCSGNNQFHPRKQKIDNIWDKS